MTLQRPNAVIYQEYESITTATDVPDLNALIVGPCYQILDYLDDKSDCQEDTDYGELNETIPSAGSSTYTSPVAVVFARPKNMTAGAELDSSSVKLFFDELRVVITNYTVSAENSIYVADDTIFKANDISVGGGIHFGQAGVGAGDTLRVQVQAGAVADYVKTVKSLAYWFEDAGSGSGVLTLETDGVAAGDLVTISNDLAGTSRNGVYTVKRVISQTQMEMEEVIPGTGIFGGAAAVTCIIRSPGGTEKVNTADVDLDDWCYLRTTTDFAASAAGTNKWRIERELDDVEMDAADIEISGNQITVKAALTTDVSATLTGKDIIYSEIYFEYMALRQDLALITDTTSATERVNLLGKLDSRNPLAVGAYVASLNAPTYPISVYGIDDVDNEAAAYLEFIDKVSTVRDIYTITPLTYSTTVLASLNTTAETMADPSYNLDHGTRQKFRMICGAVELVTTKYMQSVTGGATTEQGTQATPTEVDTGTFGAGITLSLLTAGAVPGDKIMIYDAAGGGGVLQYEYTIAHVNGALAFEVDSADGPVTTLNPVTILWDIRLKDAATGIETSLHVSGGGGTETLTASALDKFFDVLYLPNATFDTNGIIPGDTIEIPSDPNTNTWTTYQSWVVAEVLSEERLRVVNNGTNTSTTANELPHLVKRIGGALVTQAAMYVRVARDLTKSQQVTEMLSVATSFSSKRLFLAYPDEVEVADLVNGSLPRYGSTSPAAAGRQEGYYLACAVAGMTASSPSQKGFTYAGIAGISAIYNSSDYFNEQQMTDLSNGGVYVFQQDSENSLPYTIHEVTTDVSSLQTGEYMYVKNVDFVSMTLLDTILGFIGRWNVTPQALEFIEEAVQGDINNLKARYVSKIGPPLIDATITGVEESSLSSDRVEAYVNGNFPMVLNTIGLHLVA